MLDHALTDFEGEVQPGEAGIALLESLDDAREDRSAVEAAWNDEVARRVAELDSGKAKTVPWEEVRQRVAAKLRIPAGRGITSKRS